MLGARRDSGSLPFLAISGLPLAHLFCLNGGAMKTRRKSLPYMPWHYLDYLRDTVCLSPMADLLYRRLIEQYWHHRCNLPFSPVLLAKLTNFTPRDWTIYWAEIESFWDINNGKLGNKRADEEFQHVQKITNIKRKAAMERWK